MSENIIAGKKRKWTEMNKVDSDPSTLLHGKIHHYAKELRKAAKTAKRFEIQRFVKRMREARKGKESGRTKADITELESQLEILKKLDLERIIGLALTSKIRKDKLLNSNEVLLDTLTSFSFSTTQKSTDLQTEKVENRLLSSPVLASEVAAAISGIKKKLYPSLDEQSVLSGAKDKSVEGKREDEGEDEDRDEDKNEDDDEDKDEWTGVMKEPSDVPDGKKLSHDYLSSDDEDKLIEAAGWESGSLDDDMEEKEEDYTKGDILMSSPRKTREASRSRKDKKPPENEISSQFLPSLSVGYVRGDSDSEFNSDVEEPMKERKNRRGQRARQAIWAQKYGRNAKHIQKEQTTALSRRNVKDEKTSARKDDTRARPSFNKGRPNTQTSMPSQPAEIKGALHPSWEAKRMLKSKERTQILPFQGKKIVFS